VQVLVLADQQSAPLTGRSVLVFHPGGPGVSAIGVLSESPPDVDYSRYVVLTWDGVTAGSGGGACGGKTVSFLTERTPEDFARLADEVGDECEGGFGSNRDIGAWQAADELETIRARLGISSFDFLGISYGTAIGEAYLWTYPTHVRRAVLDAPVALQVPWRDRVASVQAVMRGAANRLAMSCDLPECESALAGVAPAEAYESLRRAVLDKAPRVGSGSLTLTPIMFDQAAELALRSESSWPGFAQAVAEALNGDGSAIWRVGEHTYLGLDRLAFYWSICADIDRPTKAADFVDPDADPLTFAFASELAPCAALPKGVPRPRAATPPGSAPSVLVVASTADVLAPPSLLPSSPFLLSIGHLCITNVAGHTSYADPDVRAALIAFLEGDDAVREVC
jgi:pimeloyl-ACP methyl ester carboxylesterase